MKLVKQIKDNVSQILALIEKNLKLNIRFKFNLIVSFITPLITIIMPLIIMEQLFKFNDQFGPWTLQNYLVFQFIAYNIILLQSIMNEFPNQLNYEKFWKTLPFLIIAPFNRFNLLFGIFLSRIVLMSVPFAVFFILCYLYYPISILTILLVLIIYFLIALIFSGIGLILGVFAISNENIWKLMGFIITLIIWTSCVSYPFEIFPKFIQNVINLNPLYYIFNFLRMAWIEDNILNSITLHYISFIILLSLSMSLPIIGVYLFNTIFKKWGIVGY